MLNYLGNPFVKNVSTLTVLLLPLDKELRKFRSTGRERLI